MASHHHAQRETNKLTYKCQITYILNMSIVLLYILCMFLAFNIQHGQMFHDIKTLPSAAVIYFTWGNPYDCDWNNLNFQWFSFVDEHLRQLRLQFLHRHPVKDTHYAPSTQLDNVQGVADSPELIDMPPRRCFLITYWSTRPDMQSICQSVSLARWDKCPLNTFNQAVLIKGGISIHNHIEPPCQVLCIETCQNCFSWANEIFHKP